MGFFDVVKKVGNVALDVVSEGADSSAKRIDRMSDDEIEQKYISQNPDKSVSDYREIAEKGRQIKAMRESLRDHHNE